MQRPVLYQLTEHSPFMMGFVLITPENNAVIIDGGRPSDVDCIIEHVAGRKVVAWFLTHPHMDHISAFIDVVNNRLAEIDFKRVYYNFPPLDFVEQYAADSAYTLRDFLACAGAVEDKLSVVHEGDVLEIDGMRFEILHEFDPAFKNFDAVNDASIVIRLETADTVVLFLGDLGPEAGAKVLANKRDKLKCDIVQMAHHGHMCVTEAFYQAVHPRACMWCAPDWLYEESAEKEYCPGMYGTMRTRLWMEKLGVTKHYVTKDGTQRIEL